MMEGAETWPGGAHHCSHDADPERTQDDERLVSATLSAMTSTKQPRYVMASFVAPLPATVVAVGMGVWGVMAPDEGGSVRAALVLLLLMPFGYVLLALVLLGVTRLLAARGLLSQRILLGLAGGCSLVLAGHLGFTRPFGLADAIQMFATAGVVVLPLSTITVIAWWRLARYRSGMGRGSQAAIANGGRRTGSTS